MVLEILQINLLVHLKNFGLSVRESILLGHVRQMHLYDRKYNHCIFDEKGSIQIFYPC